MSRFDAIGMFWEDRPASRKTGAREIGPMPPIPETGWRPPTEFPNLSTAKVIGYDTETKDPELTTAGPGWGRGRGHIVGVSLAVEDGTSWYFPIRHETQKELNMDPAQVFRFLQDTLGDARPKVGANLIYDFGWLAAEGVKVGGLQYDVQFAEALLNSETPDVSLEGLSGRYLGSGKVTSILYDWLAQWLGGAANDRQRANIYRAPVTLAGPYAEADAALPVQLLTKQWSAMHARGVLDLFHIECRLIPLLVKMRLKGAPVDLSRAEELYERLGREALVIEAQLKEIAGQPVNPAAGASIAAAFTRLGIPHPKTKDKRTKQEKVSFSADLLEAIDHPLTNKIVEYRQLTKVRNTFIKSYILDKHVNGRLHCSFHPLKSDKGGARSGRFASSDPNLQNIPIRTELGALVRAAFVASKGARWRKYDYSQIEYRLLAHHAVGQGSDDLRAKFVANPDIDYHELVQTLVREMTGLELSRRNTKTINFGLIYGMSQPELRKRLGLDQKGAVQLFESYHRAAPFARATMEACEAEVHQFGFITTLLGRKSDFPLWGPRGEYGVAGLPYGEAILAYGPNIGRAFTHKALNRKLQGGAADIMKKAMVDAYEAGLFDESACGIPTLTVHDELDFEDFGDLDAPCWAELAHVMENCVQTRVPIRVDYGHGDSWKSAD
jgi:DNA polymerase I-like protein with 3'-5' exonuclease and polymerase domains